MAKVIKDGSVTSVEATGPHGQKVRLAMLRAEFHAADYSPETAPPKLIELWDVSLKPDRPQTVARFYELGSGVGQSRVLSVPVMEKPSDIVEAMTRAGFTAPPVTIPVTTKALRFFHRALSR